METRIAKAKKIKLLISDVDGVLSNGQLFFDEEKMAYKAFHVHDGLGLQLLQRVGIEVGIITFCKSPIVATRMEQLGIKHVFQHQGKKIPAYEQLLRDLNITEEETAYIGDDLPDLPLIQRSGLGIAVANAAPIVCEYADWITDKPGGHGAVREVCDFILHAQEKMHSILQQYHYDENE